MNELAKLLNSVEDSYYDFVSGILHYAEKKESRQKELLNYLKNNPEATSSDIILFVSNQPDFSEDAAYMHVG